MRAIRFWTAAFTLTLCLCAYGDRPRVVQAAPDNGATNVDPATRQIRVVFDQPMNRGGVSWVGGGENFPETIGRPRWIDGKTCILTVKLKPDHEYRLSINSDTFQNFRSAQGEPAIPYPIAFKTGSPRKTATTGAAGAINADNERAVEELKRAIDEEYSYRDLRGVDWDKAFQQSASALLAADSADVFAAQAATLLAPARDVHMWLKVGENSVPTHRRTYVSNFNLDALRKAVPDLAQRSDSVWTGRFSDGASYLLITSWDARNPRALEPAYVLLAEADPAKGLIIDV